MALCPEARVPFSQACSGVGTCLDAVSCACPMGLSGVSDWALGAPTCAISPTAIRAMYSVLAIAQLAQFVFASYFLWRLRESFFTHTARKRKRDYYAAVMAISTIFSAFFFIPLAIIRALQPAEPTTTIGTSPTTTALFTLGTSAFWLQALIFTRSLLTISLEQLRIQTLEAKANVATAIAIMQKGFPVVLIFVEFVCIVPIFLLASSDPWTWYALIFVHYEGISFACVFFALYIFPVLLRHVMRDLDAAISRGAAMGLDVDQLKRVQTKLRRLMSDLRNQALFNFVCASPFGVLPGLQQIGSYWTPVAFTAAAVVSITSMYAELPVRAAVKSSSALQSASQDKNAKVGVDAKDGPKNFDEAPGSPNSSMVSRVVSQGEA